MCASYAPDVYCRYPQCARVCPVPVCPCGVTGVTWTEENLFTYLENPKKFIKVTNGIPAP